MIEHCADGTFWQQSGHKMLPSSCNILHVILLIPCHRHAVMLVLSYGLYRLLSDLRAGLISQAKGSAFAEFDKTKVVCAV